MPEPGPESRAAVRGRSTQRHSPKGVADRTWTRCRNPDDAMLTSASQALSDLPPLGPGEPEVERPYATDAKTAFQRWARLGAPEKLHDTRTPAVNDETIKRLQHIPPGGCARAIPDGAPQWIIETLRLSVSTTSPRCSIDGAFHEVRLRLPLRTASFLVRAGVRPPPRDPGLRHIPLVSGLPAERVRDDRQLGAAAAHRTGACRGDSETDTGTTTNETASPLRPDAENASPKSTWRLRRLWHTGSRARKQA